MRARIVVSLVLLLAAFSGSGQAQVVVTDDANTSSFTPKTNYGSSIALIVCSGSNTYIKFSFANLPSGINGTSISGANAVLYVDAVLASGTMDVYAVNGSWSEGTITYNSAPVLGNKILSAVLVSKTGYLSLNLTSTVQAWLNGTLANNGIALVPSSGSSISVSFDSKENIFTSHTTQLPMVLVSAGPQGPQGPQGLTGAAGPQGVAGPPGPAGATGPGGPPGQQGPQGLLGLTGLTGATGAAGAAGPAGANGTGFNFRNAFDNSASYAVNDVVTFQGTSYVATAANQGPNNPTPDQNSTAWSVMAAQGAAGAAGAPGPAGAAGPAGAQGAVGPVGPPGPIGPMPTGAALTTGANTFAGTQTVNGNLALSGAGAGVQFGDGTLQTTAATGAASGVPSGFMIMSTSSTPPAGYSSTPYQITTSGTTWNTTTTPGYGGNAYGFSDGYNVLWAGMYLSASNQPVAIVGQVGPCSTICLPSDPNNHEQRDVTMPTTAYNPAASAINPSTNPTIYVIGGSDVNGNGLSTNQIYNGSSASWTTGAPMPTARSFLSTATVNGLIYAIGGFTSVNYQTGNVVPTAVVEIYNPVTNSWSTGVALPAPGAPSTAVVNGTIYVIGLGTTGCAVYSFNPSTSASWAQNASIPGASCSFLTAADSSGNIFAVDTLGRTVGVYGAVSGFWTALNGLPFANINAGVTWAKGVLYVIQGVNPNGIGNTNQVQEFNTNGFTAPATFYFFTKN